jgi:hypothetical protein
MRCFPYCLKQSAICLSSQMTVVRQLKPKFFFTNVYHNLHVSNKYTVSKLLAILGVKGMVCLPIDTKPMMSSILISNVKSIYLPQYSQHSPDDESEDEEYEPITLRIAVDHDGNLMTSNQFHDYYYRGPSLQSMNFFDFARSVKLEKKINAPKKYNRNSS